MNIPPNAQLDLHSQLIYSVITKMLCDFLTFVGPCLLILDLQEETCISQCQSLGRKLPSYDTVQAFIDEIVQLKKPTLNDSAAAFRANKSSKLKWRFPIAVNYDFEREKWVDSRSEIPINELPWAPGSPYLSDVLVFGVLNSDSEGKFQHEHNFIIFSRGLSVNIVPNFTD